MASAPFPLRVLVVGAGPAAVDMHLPVLARLRDQHRLELTHVCDLDTRRATAARAAFGFLEHSGDAAVALNRGDIDAVYIFASAQLHFEYGLTALRSGKHLFVEKPIAPSHRQALELAQAASRGGRIAVGGHNRRFQGALAAVRARAGKGSWQLAEAVFHKPAFGKAPPFGARTWLSANGIHALDALVFMMGGLPAHLIAQAAGEDPAVPSIFSALMRWDDGREGVFLCNNAAGSRREEYIFHTSGETCCVTAAGLSIETGGTRVDTPMPTVGDGVAAEHEAFLHAIHNGASAANSLAAIAPSLYLAELIESGFCGAVPQSTTETPVTRPIRRHSQSILVDYSGGTSPALAQLLPHFALVSLDDVARSPACKRDVVGAILGRGAAALRPDILAKLPQLAVVGIVGLSVARYEPETLLARGITLVNASTAYADSVAEFALGLAILARRRAFMSHQIMRAGGWGSDWLRSGLQRAARSVRRALRGPLQRLRLEPLARQLWQAAKPTKNPVAANPPAVRTLRGATAGLIGWSANARAFCERLTAAGVTVRVYSEHAAPAAITAAGARPGTLEEVLGAEVVSLHRGLTPRTRHCIGARELARLRPGAVLINIARGALIDPDALLTRLRTGDITACLDTFSEEPPAGSDPLRSLPNVFLTSHIAGGSPDMHAAADREVVRKVAAFLAGDSVVEVSREQLATMS